MPETITAPELDTAEPDVTDAELAQFERDNPADPDTEGTEGLE